MQNIYYKLKDVIKSANTGLDAIQRAPIVNYETKYKCLRIQDISQSKRFEDWGNTEVQTNYYNEFRLQKNDIIIARTGSTIGINTFINYDIPAVFNNGLIRLRTNELVIPYYCYLFMQTKYFKEYINNISCGTSTQPNMKINDLLDVDFPYVDINDQQHIVNTIGSIDDLIEKKFQIIKKMEHFSSLLYKNSVNNCLCKTKVKLSEYTKCLNGYSYKGEELSENSNIGMITIKNFDRSGGFKIDGIKPLTPLKQNFPKIDKFALLVAHTDLTQNAEIIGNPILLLNTSNYDILTYSMDIVQLLPQKNVGIFFLFEELKSTNFKKYSLGYTHGTTVLHLSKDALKEYSFYIPNDPKLIENLDKKISNIYERISIIFSEIEVLNSLKKIFLDKYFR